MQARKALGFQAFSSTINLIAVIQHSTSCHQRSWAGTSVTSGLKFLFGASLLGIVKHFFFLLKIVRGVTCSKCLLAHLPFMAEPLGKSQTIWGCVVHTIMLWFTWVQLCRPHRSSWIHGPVDPSATVPGCHPAGLYLWGRGPGSRCAADPQPGKLPWTLTSCFSYNI